MAPTMTAELLPELGAIRLTITTALDLATLMRADVNGTATVRTRAGGLATQAPSAIIITDYEPGQGTVHYTATDTAGGSASLALEFALDSPWLFVPVMPSYSARLTSVLSYAAQVPSRSTELEPLGREFPTVVIRPMGSKRGSLGLYAGTHEQAQAIVDALGKGEVLMLRQPEHRRMDMYFIARSVDIGVLQVGGASTEFGVTVDYLQVARPTGPLASALGWTFAAVDASADSFATITSRYASFEALRLNEPL